MKPCGVHGSCLTAVAQVVTAKVASSFTVTRTVIPSAASRSASFLLHQPVAVATTTSKSSRLFSSVIPEPGACPECSDDNAYWDGSTLFVCTACGHEWPVESAEASTGDEASTEDEDVTRDSNGNILEAGDTVVLIKDLAKGLKKGMKVSKIRLGDYGGGHDMEANIPGMGTYALKSQFVKKV
eukprot:scaffold145922_cov69-Attheya_sp.AAC.1